MEWPKHFSGSKPTPMPCGGVSWTCFVARPLSRSDPRHGHWFVAQGGLQEC